MCYIQWAQKKNLGFFASMQDFKIGKWTRSEWVGHKGKKTAQVVHLN